MKEQKPRIGDLVRYLGPLGHAYPEPIIGLVYKILGICCIVYAPGWKSPWEVQRTNLEVINAAR